VDAAGEDKAWTSTPVLWTYGSFLAGAYWVYQHMGQGESSAVLTVSVIVQCMALSLLLLQLRASGSVQGFSANSLMLEAGSVACRLSGITWLNGYLPVDASGDWLFQTVDFVSLLLALWLLYEVLVLKRHTYDETSDSFPTAPIALGCFVTAMLFHADNHDRPMFDCLWMAGLLMSVAAVIPQYGVIIRSGGQVQALVSHSIAAMGVSRACSGIFMWNAREHITCKFWIHDFNHAILVILAAHALHIVLLSDFAYYYLKSVATHGFRRQLDLPMTASYTV